MKTADKIAVMQAYEDGKPIEFRHARIEEWTELMRHDENIRPGPVWNWESMRYRIKTEPAPIPDFIDWNSVHSDYRFMARDENGEAYVYKTRPNKTDRAFTPAGPDNALGLASAFATYGAGNLPWDKSLVERPA